jgi:hypothetical protein
MPVTQNEDVYETSDLPEDEQHLRAADERFESDSIERVQLDVAGAFDKFKGKTLATDGVGMSAFLLGSKFLYCCSVRRRKLSLKLEVSFRSLCCNVV